VIFKLLNKMLIELKAKGSYNLQSQFYRNNNYKR